MTLGNLFSKLAQSLQLVFLCLLLALPSQSLVADSFSDRRAHVGIKLFRTLLAAEQNVAAGSANRIYFVYATDQAQAQQHATEFQEITAQKAQVIALSDMSNNSELKPRAIFVSQKLTDSELSALIQYSIRHRAITFSPFEGDVENGVLGGLSVEATIKPFLNMATLKASGVDIKSFYLKVAKRHE